MIRVNFLVEGQTEEMFVNRFLADILRHRGLSARVRCIETSRKNGRVYQGGVSTYRKLRDDLARWLAEDPEPAARFTTFFDLYGLPEDTPGFGRKGEDDPVARAARIERAIARDFGDDGERLLPHIQPYEFEALLFSAPGRWPLHGRDWPRQREALEAIRDQYPGPEYINDDRPPSRRLMRVVRGYRKVLDGPRFAAAIGLKTLRRECRHFDAWLASLERLA